MHEAVGALGRKGPGDDIKKQIEEYIDYNGDGVISATEYALWPVELGGWVFDIVTIPSGEGIAIAASIKLIGKALPKLAKNLTKSQLKSIASLKKQISIHTKKLEAYKANPLKYDNKGYLKSASLETQKRIINGRINKLNREIQKFENEILKIKK